ncbi:MAG: sensor histidine kinase [Chloroflexota bacterium]
MTIPPYTDALDRGTVVPQEIPGDTAVRDTGRRAAAGRRQRVVDAWRRLLVAHPRRVEAALDVAAIAFAVLTLLQAGPAEFLIHAIFVVLIVHAFLFGLGGTLWRIGIVSVAVVGYAVAPRFGIPFPDLELTEWPLMFVIALLVAGMADRRAATARLYEALFRRASDRLLTVQEDERARLARELHDGVGQTMTALSLTLDAVSGTGASGVAMERLATARSLAEDALTETRELANRLRPARLEQVGLAAAIRDLATRAGIPVRVDIDPAAGEIGVIDATRSVEAYRIVQEAISNAARHSGASGVRVAVGRTGDSLTIVVEDAGRGFDAAVGREGGLGLIGMHERAVLLGARLSIETAPGRGTRVALDVPIDQRDQPT